MSATNLYYIKPEQLRVGLYVHLDLGWMDHPFTFNNFKIKDEEQIALIKKICPQRVRYDPLRSDCEPLPEIAGTNVVVTPTAQPSAAPAETAHAVKAPQQRLEALHAAIHLCQQKFTHATQEVRTIERDILIAPAKSLQQAQGLIDNMVNSLLSEGEIVVHAMQPKPGKDDRYSHALNVTVIAMILAKSLDISQENAALLGLGALFHDIGKAQLPSKITRKLDPLTKAESALLQQHSAIGAQYAADIGMHEQIVRIIRQHHEYMDGSGVPQGLKQEQIDHLARIVCIANMYDNLCNPLSIAQAMTPYEALSHMFTHQRSKCDSEILKLLIRNLGIYPPGSIVRLSSDDYGIVISVNPSKPLRPFVMMYTPGIPREMPRLINLGEEASISITHCLRPSQLPKDALDYLRPAAQVNYFFDSEASTSKSLVQ